MYDTFAFRFTCRGDPAARTVVYLVRGDFATPHDAFFEGDVPHWEDEAARRLTWGRMAGPMDLDLSAEQYAYYAALAEACATDFMSVVLLERVARLFGNSSEEA